MRCDSAREIAQLIARRGHLNHHRGELDMAARPSTRRPGGTWWPAIMVGAGLAVMALAWMGAGQPF
jgi:hypothetical protein